MYIGEFCKHTKTTPKMIRYYESIGLLPPAKRRGNYRVYDDTYIETVRLIKLAQIHGFSLAELKQVIAGVDVRLGVPPILILQAVAQKRKAIAEQIRDLQGIDVQLAAFEVGLKQTPCCADLVAEAR